MNIERPLQVCVAAMACIGTISLGVGADNLGLAAAGAVVSLGSLVLCDRLRWLQLSTSVSNIASIAVLVVALARAFSKAQEDRILIMAELMAHLQFILQFKAKSTRNYWLLATVSFLQMAVAAALQTGFVFALLLVIYLFWALFFLGYFTLLRESRRNAAEADAARGALSAGRGFMSLSIVATPDDARRDFARRMTLLGFGTLGLAAVLFAAVPRIGQKAWEPTAIVGPRTVGFAPEINLARGGEAFEDPEVVMQVQFFDYATRKPLQIDGDVYMRGTAVTKYLDGRWDRTRSFIQNRPAALSELSSGAGAVIQKVAIEPLSRPVIFSCYPAFSDGPEPLRSGLFYQPHLGQFSRADHLQTKRLEYELVSLAFQRQRQGSLVPPLFGFSDRDGNLLQMPPLRDGRDPLEGLKALAAQITADVPPDNYLLRAKRLEAYLRDSGRFQYTLELPERPKDVDPIEDFVVNQPRGHCEFYAGALALMLRSVGIRSRIVLGYRGGEYNVVGGFYEFQQLHAHSWVEAYLPADQVPLDRLAETPGLVSLAETNGAWLQLDGTAPASFISTTVANTTWSQIQQVLDYVRFLWVNYVVGMDAMRQHESVYVPLIAAMSDAAARLRDPQSWNAWKAQAADIFIFAARPSNFSILVAIALGLFFIAWVRRRRRGSRTKMQSASAARKRRAPPAQEEFYLRMERLLAKLSLVRTTDQTPRELALAAGGALAELPQTRTAAPLPRRIVDHYYRIRYGGGALDEAQRKEVESALAALATAVDNLDPANKPKPR